MAELVKNSYDADATKVEIRIEDDCIVVSDNGHGMTDEDFEQRWMRVGSTHKVEEKTSRKLRRPLTGSKGVGRLAVQFLASELELISVPQETIGEEEPGRQGFRATVDWDTAVQAGETTRHHSEVDEAETALEIPRVPRFGQRDLVSPATVPKIVRHLRIGNRRFQRGFVYS